MYRSKEARKRKERRGSASSEAAGSGAETEGKAHAISGSQLLPAVGQAMMNQTVEFKRVAKRGGPGKQRVILKNVKEKL